MLALAYRFYGAFLASRVLTLTNDTKTPAQRSGGGSSSLEPGPVPDYEMALEVTY